MAEVIYIVIDENDGIPLWAFRDKTEALVYQEQCSDLYPESWIAECDLG